MFCSNCGKQVSDTAKFCAHCGAPQSAPVEAAPTFVPPVQEFTPPAQEFTPPVQQFTPPVQEFTPPAQQFTPPAQNYTPQYYPQQPAYETPAAPKKKKGWIAIVAAVVVVAIIAGILVLTLPSAEEKRYEQAVTLYEAGDYAAALELFEDLDINDSAAYAARCRRRLEALNRPTEPTIIATEPTETISPPARAEPHRKGGRAGLRNDRCGCGRILCHAGKGRGTCHEQHRQRRGGCLL